MPWEEKEDLGSPGVHICDLCSLTSSGTGPESHQLDSPLHPTPLGRGPPGKRHLEGSCSSVPGGQERLPWCVALREAVPPRHSSGVITRGPHGVGALLCLGVSECELPLGICEGRSTPVLAWPCVLVKETVSSLSPTPFPRDSCLGSHV